MPRCPKSVVVGIHVGKKMLNNGPHNETNRRPTKIIIRRRKCENKIETTWYQCFTTLRYFNYVETERSLKIVISLQDQRVEKNSSTTLFNIRLGVKTAKFGQKKQNSHLIQVHIFRNQMKRFCSTSQEIWFMCMKNSMRSTLASRYPSEHILERLN